MTREEAAKYLEAPALNLNPELDLTVAVHMAIAALRGPRWVRTSERNPRDELPSKICHVLAINRLPSGGLCECVVMAVDINEEPEKYPYWMPLPPVPRELKEF